MDKAVQAAWYEMNQPSKMLSFRNTRKPTNGCLMAFDASKTIGEEGYNYRQRQPYTRDGEETSPSKVSGPNPPNGRVKRYDTAPLTKRKSPFSYRHAQVIFVAADFPHSSY